MWAWTIPANGVRCHEPSIRGSRYSPDAAASRIRSHSCDFGTDAARATSTFASLNRVDSDCTRPVACALSYATPAMAHRSASPDASTMTSAANVCSPPLFQIRTARIRFSTISTPVAHV